MWVEDDEGSAQATQSAGSTTRIQWRSSIPHTRNAQHRLVDNVSLLDANLRNRVGS
jgi:hypothetical protein